MELTERHHENGQLMLQGFIDDNGEAIGLWKSYYKNGKLEAEGEYKDGQKHGTWYYYFDKGQKKAIVNYEFGITEGSQMYFNEDGTRTNY